jgi:hypothetical protein
MKTKFNYRFNNKQQGKTKQLLITKTSGKQNEPPKIKSLS